MNVTEIVRQLRDERSRLDSAIQALEGVGGGISAPIKRRGRPPGTTNKPTAGGPKKRRGMSAAAANVSQKLCGSVGRPQKSPGRRGFNAASISQVPETLLNEESISPQFTLPDVVFLHRSILHWHAAYQSDRLTPSADTENTRIENRFPHTGRG
jgi:hypothetical protein